MTCKGHDPGRIIGNEIHRRDGDSRTASLAIRHRRSGGGKHGNDVCEEYPGDDASSLIYPKRAMDVIFEW